MKIRLVKEALHMKSKSANRVLKDNGLVVSIVLMDPLSLRSSYHLILYCSFVKILP